MQILRPFLVELPRCCDERQLLQTLSGWSSICAVADLCRCFARAAIACMAWQPDLLRITRKRSTRASATKSMPTYSNAWASWTAASG